MVKSDAIWYTDVFVLPKRPMEFFPSKRHTQNEQANALVRLIIYVTCGVFFYRGNFRALYIGLAGIVAITLLFRGRNGKFAGLNAKENSLECRQSTRENPFANMLVSEYGKELPAKPCQYDDIKEDVEKNFNIGLYRDLDDPFNKNNSQREFMTVPNGGQPPDTRAFAEFLNGPKGNCKSDNAACTGFLP